MSAEQVLARVERRGVTLTPAGGRLRFRPKGALTPELVEELRTHKGGILRILERREVGNVAEVFEMARARFGPSRRFDPSEHPPSSRELWVNPDKAKFYAEVRQEDDGWRRRGEYPPHIRPVDPKDGAA